MTSCRKASATLRAWLAAVLLMMTTGPLCAQTVDTAEIFDNAVTSAKIQNFTIQSQDILGGAVNASKIPADAVTSSKIKNFSIQAQDILGGAVNSSKIQDFTIQAQDIQGGAIDASKLSDTAVFGRIIVVRSDPSDPVGNCGGLQAALAGITDNDADNRHLIWLEPGIYDCGATPVQMKDYVDIQGSGWTVTKITGVVFSHSSGVVNAANNSELRHLTVAMGVGFVLPVDFTQAILCEFKTDFRVSSVVAEGVGSPITSASFGLRLNACTDLTVTDVMVTTGEAISDSIAVGIGGGSTASLVNVTGISNQAVTNNTGLSVTGGSVVSTRNSVFFGNTGGLFTSSGATAIIISTRLIGPVTGTGTSICVGAYDGSFTALNASCL